MKYKIGDRVVNVTSGIDSVWFFGLPLYTAGIVIRQLRNYIDVKFEGIESEQRAYIAYFHELELESVFNSPVYQLLKEEA